MGDDRLGQPQDPDDFLIRVETVDVGAVFVAEPSRPLLASAVVEDEALGVDCHAARECAVGLGGVTRHDRNGPPQQRADSVRQQARGVDAGRGRIGVVVVGEAGRAPERREDLVLSRGGGGTGVRIEREVKRVDAGGVIRKDGARVVAAVGQQLEHPGVRPVRLPGEAVDLHVGDRAQRLAGGRIDGVGGNPADPLQPAIDEPGRAQLHAVNREGPGVGGENGSIGRGERGRLTDGWAIKNAAQHAGSPSAPGQGPQQVSHVDRSVETGCEGQELSLKS